MSQILRIANERLIPVTPRGAGTSLEGNPLPVHKGIVLDYQQMDQILAIRADAFQTDVQPGIKYLDMNKALSRHGLFFPPDPGANATIGGMIGNSVDVRMTCLTQFSMAAAGIRHNRASVFDRSTAPVVLRESLRVR